MNMVGNDWENSRNGPNSSKCLPNFPKMSQAVPKCPKMSQNVPKCPTSDASLSERTCYYIRLFSNNRDNSALAFHISNLDLVIAVVILSSPLLSCCRRRHLVVILSSPSSSSYHPVLTVTILSSPLSSPLSSLHRYHLVIIVIMSSPFAVLIDSKID